MTSTAGYSGSPLVKKLGLKSSHRAALISPPAGFIALLGREVDVAGRPEELSPGRFDSTCSAGNGR